VSAVDALAGLLDGPRAQGAFLLRSILNPPWSLRIQDEAPLTIVAMVRGDAWVFPDGGSPVSLHPGDIAIARGPDPYTVADDPATSPQVIIHPGQRCTTVDNPLVPLLADEIVKDEPGQEAVLDRLLDLLVIASLRAWFSRPDAQAPAWYRAHSDPVVGKALRMLHNNPEHPWTLAELAARSGASRATLARRFSELVGEPPMSFLAGWRLTLAADLLRQPDASVSGVAQQVGYGSPFALSTAFKRFHGVSPREHRANSPASA
jgi:AraC-like DNA-binding protein